MIEKERILHLFHILSNATSTMTARELAHLLEISERTLKNDMLDFRVFAEECGGYLNARKNVGYWLEVVDPSKYETIKKQINILFLSHDSFQLGNFQTRINVILRRLLLAEEHIKLDEISAKLYLSKSSLKNELKEVRRILKTYNLQLETKPGLGNIIIGSEFDRRLCMLRVYEYHYYESEPLFNDDEFIKMFACDSIERNEIRHIFNKVLRESETNMIDNFLNWFVRYLTLMRNRYNSGHIVVFEANQKAYLRQYLQYQVAVDIINELQIYKGFNINDDEIHALEILLLIWNDLPTSRDFNKEYPIEYKEINAFIPDMVADIKTDFNFDISQIIGFDKLLMSFLIPIMIQMHFSCEEYSVLGGYGFNEEVRSQPFSVAIAFSIFSSLKRRFKCEFSVYNHLNLAVRFCSLFSSLEYEYKPQRALVCSVFGLEASNMIKKIILKHFNNGEFDKIDTYELYDMRKFKKEEYDFVLVNIPDYVYKYDWAHMFISMRPSKKELDDLYNKFIVNGIQIEHLINSDNLKNVVIYHNFNFESVDSFIKFISYKLVKKPQDVFALMEYVSLIFHISAFNNICTIFISKKYIGRNIIEIYELEKQAIYYDQKFSYIIIAVVDCMDNLLKAKLVDDISRITVNNISILQEIINGSKMSGLLTKIKGEL